MIVPNVAATAAVMAGAVLIEDRAEGGSWVDRHSVNCYFCGKLFDERDGLPADGMNGGDGGDACPDCAKERGHGRE